MQDEEEEYLRQNLTNECTPRGIARNVSTTSGLSIRRNSGSLPFGGSHPFNRGLGGITNDINFNSTYNYPQTYMIDGQAINLQPKFSQHLVTNNGLQNADSGAGANNNECALEDIDANIYMRKQNDIKRGSDHASNIKKKSIPAGLAMVEIAPDEQDHYRQEIGCVG